MDQMEERRLALVANVALRAWVPLPVRVRRRGSDPPVGAADPPFRNARRRAVRLGAGSRGRDAGDARRPVDGAEFAIRAVLGQQVSTKAARTHAARLVSRYGTPVGDLFLFPLEFDPSSLAMPESRRRTMAALLAALQSGLDLSPSADRAAARAWLTTLPGFGPWTVESILMRALGDPDAFLPTDLGIRLAAEALGLPTIPAALVKRSEMWRPWRAYAVQHLWATGDHEVNRIPA